MYKSILLLFTIFLSVSTIAAPPTQVSLSKAIEQNMVTITAKTTNQEYNRQGLELTIKNNGSLRYNLMLNTGVVFAPDSGNYQPLILAGGERLFMTPLSESKVRVQTFCADSRKLAPQEGLSYSFSKNAGDTLIHILSFMQKNRIYGTLGQSAVWVFTNNHDLREVYDGGNDFLSKKLLDYIVKETGREMPGYFAQPVINNEPAQEVYDPKTLKIYARFEHELEESKELTLGIYNDKGEMVQPVFENRRYGKAGHRFTVEFEAEGVEAGKYYIRLKSADEILNEQMVEVK